MTGYLFRLLSDFGFFCTAFVSFCCCKNSFFIWFFWEVEKLFKLVYSNITLVQKFWSSIDVLRLWFSEDPFFYSCCKIWCLIVVPVYVALESVFVHSVMKVTTCINLLTMIYLAMQLGKTKFSRGPDWQISSTSDCVLDPNIVHYFPLYCNRCDFNSR